MVSYQTTWTWYFREWTYDLLISLIHLHFADYLHRWGQYSYSKFLVGVYSTINILQSTTSSASNGIRSRTGSGDWKQSHASGSGRSNASTAVNRKTATGHKLSHPSHASAHLHIHGDSSKLRRQVC